MAQGKPPPDERYLRYGQLVWMAVPVDEFPGRGKSIIKTRMKPVILTYLASEDIDTIRDGFTSRQLRINRMIRWCEEAYDQGALLTQLDLAVLLNVCDAVVSDYVNEYQRASGRMLPTRGNIHDLSGAITHKREIIALYLQGCLTPTIARKTRHSKDAVDRYIRDYEAVKLVRTATADIDKISQITHLSKRVIKQYLDLIPDNELTSIELKSLVPQSVEERLLDDQ
ncbi:DUF1670 domain-containing protein [Candidatus Poribacteria bacterium]